MTRRATRTARADADLIAIGAYIAAEDPNAALRITAELDGKGPLLAEFPGLGRLDEQTGRRIFVVGNYLILYRETPDGVTILRYFHGRRDRRSL